MQYNCYDLGHVEKDRVVEVALAGNSANIRLMDPVNLIDYRAGRGHSFYGGLFSQSPARIRVPATGHWYVTVDLQGLRGTVSSAVRVM